MSQLPEFVQLTDKINDIFNETCLYNLSDAKIESLFSTARQLEMQILLMSKECPKTLDTLNSQLHQVENENFPVIHSFNDFEMACDRLLIVFFTNTKQVNDIALSKAVQHYISIFSVSQFEKLYYKLVAQCAMSNVVLSIMNDCDENCTNLDIYNAKIYQELPILLDRGRCGFTAATKLIHSLMFDETSLEALLKALLMYEENSVMLVFVHGTILKTLQKVDNDYVKFWRLLGKVKDQTLLPKLADRFPDFLSCLEKFIISSGDGLKITRTEDSKVHVDWVDSLTTHRELISLIRNMVYSGCHSGTLIKEAIIEKQQRALRYGEIDQHYGWLELTKECLSFHK